MTLVERQQCQFVLRKKAVTVEGGLAREYLKICLTSIWLIVKNRVNRCHFIFTFQEIGLCDSAVVKKKGGDFCFLGASFWCASKQNAINCNVS